MVGALERGQFALDRRDLAGDARDAFALLARGVLELVALRGEICERGGQIGENLLGGAQFAVGLRHFGIDTAAAARAFVRFLADAVFLGGKAGERSFGVGGQLLLAQADGELSAAEKIFSDLTTALADLTAKRNQFENAAREQGERIARIAGEIAAIERELATLKSCLLYTSPSPRDR